MVCVTSKRSFLASVLIVLNVSAQISPDSQLNKRDVNKSNVERGCMSLNECDYYRMLLSNNIAGLSKEAIRNEIEEHTCNLPKVNPTGNQMTCRSKYFGVNYT